MIMQLAPRNITYTCFDFGQQDINLGIRKATSIRGYSMLLMDIQPSAVKLTMGG